MPATPEDKSNLVGNVMLKRYKYTTPDKNLLYQLSYHDIATDVSKLDAEGKDAILQEARRNCVDVLKGKVFKEGRIELDKHPGREVHFEFGSRPMFGRGRAYLVGNRLYQVLLLATDKQVLTTKTNEEFFASFRLTDEKGDAQKLQGTWIAVSWAKDGEPARDVEPGKVAFHFRADKLSFLIGKAEQVATFRLDTDKSPKRMTLVDNDNNKTSVAIYEFRDDKLRFCALIKEDGNYPKEFTGAKGHTLITFRRAKEGEVPVKPAR
jgi:uncharacterized protein (TIGR03067 family)